MHEKLMTFFKLLRFLEEVSFVLFKSSQKLNAMER